MKPPLLYLLMCTVNVDGESMCWSKIRSFIASGANKPYTILLLWLTWYLVEIGIRAKNWCILLLKRPEKRLVATLEIGKINIMLGLRIWIQDI